ncbi:MAG: hypothetical protein B6U78_01040 [Candidatus Aenigmarchaeota archaeon ex4484_224]|nr:MAG: hypothetical protein B6U78_01040 [Candidatus Aenigmarchaeota archaeon ex4484_224]
MKTKKVYLAGPFISYKENEFRRDEVLWKILEQEIPNIKELIKSYEDWRDLFLETIDKGILKAYEFLDPRKTGGRYIGGKLGYFQRDLEYIDECDLVVAYRPQRWEIINGKIITQKIEIEGTSAEIAYAYAKNKIIYFVDESPVPHEFLHGFSSMIFRGIPPLIYFLYVEENYGFFPAVNKIHEIF